MDRPGTTTGTPAKDLAALKEGVIVRMKPFTLVKKEWEKVVVTKRLHERSHELDYRWNYLQTQQYPLERTNEPSLNPHLEHLPDPEIERHEGEKGIRVLIWKVDGQEDQYNIRVGMQRIQFDKKLSRKLKERFNNSQLPVTRMPLRSCKNFRSDA